VTPDTASIALDADGDGVVDVVTGQALDRHVVTYARPDLRGTRVDHRHRRRR
jgi:hypothetical protein